MRRAAKRAVSFRRGPEAVVALASPALGVCCEIEQVAAAVAHVAESGEDASHTLIVELPASS